MASVLSNIPNKVEMVDAVEISIHLPSSPKKPKKQFHPPFEDDPYIRFDRIFELLDGKYTRDLYDRHAVVLSKLTKIYRGGVVIADAKHLATVLELAREKILQGGIVLIPSVIKLIEHFGLPLELAQIELRDRAELKSSLKSLVTALSNLFSLQNEEMTDLAAHAIYVLTGGDLDNDDGKSAHRVDLASFSLNESPVLPDPVKMRRTEIHHESQGVLLSAGEDSPELIGNLTLALNQATCNTNYLSLLKCFRWLSKSDVCTKKMMDTQSFQTIYSLLTRRDRFIAFFCVEVLWNSLETKHCADIATLLSSKECLSVLKVMFDELTIQGQRQSDHQLRNEILILFIKISQLAPDNLEAFMETDLIDSITLFLTHSELKIDEPAVARWSLTNGHDDFEFKKLLITLSTQLTTSPTNLATFLEDRLLEFAMLYMNGDSENEGVKAWRPPQRRQLQIQIISLLSQLIPKVSREFRNMDGYSILIGFIRHLIVQGKSIEMKRVDIAREHYSLLRATLGLVLNLTELGPTSKKMLASFGIFTNLMSLLQDDTQPTMIWIMSLMICSSLCQGYKANKLIFGTEGVETVLKFLSYTSADPHEKESVILAAVECIWGAVCGNVQNEDLFFHKQGIFLLMDLLEGSTSNMKRHILGCVLDLLENPKPIYHLIQWRTKKRVDRGIEHLLIDIWSQEELALGVESAPDGSILLQNKWTLQGKNQRVVNLPKDGVEPDGGRAIHELQENLRAKIYSLFCKLGFERFNESLNTAEKIKLTLISKYLDFKIGEVWSEISGELEFEGIRPVSPDLDCLLTIKEVMVKKAEGVQQKQYELCRRSAEINKKDEAVFYDKFLELTTMTDGRAAPPPKHLLHSWKMPNYHS